MTSMLERHGQLDSGFIACHRRSASIWMQRFNICSKITLLCRPRPVGPLRVFWYRNQIERRFCTDLRKMNSVTKADSFPLPRMDDCIDQVGSAKFVSKFDLLKGYWQVPLSERAQEISSFVTPSGLYSYTVMPFGLRNGTATFQWLMNRVVAGLEGCSIYLDDLVIFSDTCGTF